MSAISQWTLDEGTGTTVGDSVGSNTGTLNNSLGWSVVTAPLTFSNPGSLYAASAYYVSLANDFSVGPSSSYSVSLWARWPSTPTDRNPAFAFDSTNGDFGFSLGSTADGNGKIALEVSEYANGYQTCQGPTIVPDQWYHLCAVLRSGGTADLYVDGVYQASVTYDAFTTAIAVANANGRTIGGEKYNSSVYWQASCYVDDVRTFDHELSGAEITALAERGGTGPIVSFTQSTSSIAENGGTVSIIATMSATASATVTIAVGFAGTATTGSDYTVSTTSIEIASGQTSGSITATAINDSVYEGNEAFTASITSVSGGGASASSTASTSAVTIVDDESQPVVSLSGPTFATQSETSAFSRSVFLLTLNNASYQDVTVGLNFSGSATLNTDYTASSNSVLIAAGGTSGSFSVTRLADSIYEGTELIVVGIGSVTNGTAAAGASSGSATILDADAQPTVNLSASATTIAENLATTYVVASLGNASYQDVTINFGFSGTATLNTDYSASSNSLVVTAGNTSGSISITAIQDSLDENNETVLVGITSVTNGTAGATSSLSVTITDDDPTPSISISASTNSIVENGGSAALFFYLNAVSGRDATFLILPGGTSSEYANWPNDYTLSATASTISAGQTSTSISLTAIADTLFEADEIAYVAVGPVSGCQLGSPFAAQVTISNQYLAPFVSLSASTTSITENSGAATVLATLDHTHSQNVTIVFGLGGTANSASDYSVSTTSIVIASGSSSGSISITALQDSVGEANETVIVSLSNVTNGTASSAASATTVAIVDDDTTGVGTTGLSALRGLSAIH